jgi:3-oxoacyl-[acyl-carrier-protein] synthase II
MRKALADGRVTTTDVQYINAHGTSTPLNDPNESKAIKAVFGEHAFALSVSSTKSATGHMLGAAGSVEFIACTLAIRDGMVPPTINYTTPDPECDLDYTPNTPRKRDIDVAVSNSSGFGGHNVSIAVRRWHE